MSEVISPITDELSPSFSLDVDEEGQEVISYDTEGGLNLSTNSKTSPIVGDRNDGRGKHYPLFPNSFGLPSFLTCPGHTEEFCKPYCYGVNAEGRTNVRNNLRRNLEILRGKTEEEMYELLTSLMNDYQELFDKYVEKGRLNPEDNVFRWHWDGDFFSVDYAKAVYRVIRDNPQIAHWVYTRSFREPVDIVPVFFDQGRLLNLSFYLSVDKGNIEDAKEKVALYGQTLLLAFCGSTLGESTSLAVELGKKHLTPCPENIGKLPLSLNGHGACVECRLCFKSRPNILFVNENSPPEHPQLDLLLEGVTVSLSPRRSNLPAFDSSLI